MTSNKKVDPKEIFIAILETLLLYWNIENIEWSNNYFKNVWKNKYHHLIWISLQILDWYINRKMLWEKKQILHTRDAYDMLEELYKDKTLDNIYKRFRKINYEAEYYCNDIPWNILIKDNTNHTLTITDNNKETKINFWDIFKTEIPKLQDKTISNMLSRVRDNYLDTAINWYLYVIYFVLIREKDKYSKAVYDFLRKQYKDMCWYMIWKEIFSVICKLKKNNKEDIINFIDKEYKKQILEKMHETFSCNLI